MHAEGVSGSCYNVVMILCLSSVIVRHTLHHRGSYCNIENMDSIESCQYKITMMSSRILILLADLKNQPIGSSCATHILPFCGYFKGQEQICFNPTS